MKVKTFQLIGVIFLFLGLLTIMAPELSPEHRASHNDDGHDHEENERFIFPSTIYGGILTVMGVLCLNRYDKLSARNSKNR